MRRPDREEDTLDLVSVSGARFAGARRYSDSATETITPWGAVIVELNIENGGWRRLSASGSGFDRADVVISRQDRTAWARLPLRAGKRRLVFMRQGSWTIEIRPRARPGIAAIRLTLSPANLWARVTDRMVRIAEIAREEGPEAIVGRIRAKLSPGGAPIRWRPPRARREVAPPTGDPPPPHTLAFADGFTPSPDLDAVLASGWRAWPEADVLIGDEIIDGSTSLRGGWDEILADSVDITGSVAAFRSCETDRLEGITPHAKVLSAQLARPGLVVRRLPLALGIGRASSWRATKQAPAPRAVSGSNQIRTSIILPTRDRPDLLDACLSSIFATTSSDGREIIVIDNGSVTEAALSALEKWRGAGCAVVKDDGDFNFPRLCNRGARIATGDVLLFLNDDVVATEAGWLEALSGRALGPSVGAVGALLLYPNGRVQHAGIALGLYGVAGHPWRGLTPSVDPRITHAGRRSAVTGACLAVASSRYLDCGGMDEDWFPVSLNDVDLCLRLEQRGYICVYEPAARLIHREGQTRRPDQMPENRARRAAEERAFLKRWGHQLAHDPWFTPAWDPSSEQPLER